MVIQRFDKNEHGRDLIIGDLHGCYGLLLTKLEEIDFNTQRDRLFAVGDLIDRGPNSLECLELLFENWFHSVRGNHEEMMIDALGGCSASYRCWMANGGEWALDHIDNEEFVEMVEACADLLPLAIEIDRGDHNVGIVHADAPMFWSHTLIRDRRMNTLWGRHRHERKIEATVKDIHRIYVGHTPVDKPLNLGNVRYIDTGAAWTGNLTLEEIK